MQYANALRRLGCEVYLLDSFTWSKDPPLPARLNEFRERVARYGIERVVVAAGAENGADGADLVRSVDPLLNFNYHLSPDIVSAARRSAIVDIEPGVLQYWISRRFISPAAHDVHFTTGETVGMPSSPIPDCGIDWVHIRPVVSLDLWPDAYDPRAEAFTTVSSWWGERDYVGDPDNYYDNTKRTAFREFAALPTYTDQPLELALFLAEGDERDKGDLER